MRKILIVCTSILVFSSAVFPLATPPASVNYQGVLLSSTGVPENGDRDMEFHFFDDLNPALPENEILVDRHLFGGAGPVTVSNGLFNVQLGGPTVSDGSGAGVYNDLSEVFRDFAAVYLEIRVRVGSAGGAGALETLSPRVQIVSAAYALNSSRLQGKDSSAFAPAVHEHSGSAITSGKISNAFLNTGSGNGLDADTLDGVHASGFVQVTEPNTQNAVGQLTGTFEWEAGRVAGVGTQYVTVNFTTSFSDYPVVIVTSEGPTATTEQNSIRNVTKSSFDVRINAGVLNINYFACTPGIWIVNDNLIYAAVYGGATQSREVTFFRPFPRTPAILATGCANANQDPQVDGVVYALETLQTTVTNDLDAGTRGAFVGINAGTSPCIQVLAITSTGRANNGGTYTSGGSGSLKVGNKFESGFVRIPGPPQTGTVAFSSNFATTPIVVLTGVNTDAVNNNQVYPNLTAQPGTPSFSWVINSWPLGMMWLAIDPGHASAQATRLF